ncbi:MAG: hypothetical protein J5948_04095, partial [Bacteroidales bacterium]|nr:hypothetical protein [Bacteroidales bacterium]
AASCAFAQETSITAAAKRIVILLIFNNYIFRLCPFPNRDPLLNFSKPMLSRHVCVPLGT